MLTSAGGTAAVGGARVPLLAGRQPGRRGVRPRSAPALCRQVFALIVFSCIFGEGYSNRHESQQRYCVFNHNEDACRYGGAIGVLAFMACAAFFVVDIYFPQISNATDRKYLVVSDLLFSGICQWQLPSLSGARGVPRSSRVLRFRGLGALGRGRLQRRVAAPLGQTGLCPGF